MAEERRPQEGKARDQSESEPEPRYAENGSSSFSEDIREIPEELKRSVRETDDRLAGTIQENPQLANFLDFKLLALAALIGLAVGAVARFLVGLPFILSLLLFLIAFGGAWVLLGRRRKAPARVVSPHGGGGDVRSEDADETDGEERRQDADDAEEEGQDDPDESDAAESGTRTQG